MESAERMCVFRLIIGLMVVPFAVYLYLASGNAPIATSAPAMPFEKMLASKALHARLDREIPESVPISGDESNYAAGEQIYEDNCAVCHGLSGKAQTTIAKGMYPKPRTLLEGKGVTDDSAAENFLEGGGWHTDDGYARIQAVAFDHTDVAGQHLAGGCRQAPESREGSPNK